MTEFVKPSVEYFELWPLLAVFGVACLGVVVEAFLPRSIRYTAQVVLALGGLVLALVGVVLVAQDVQTYDDGAARGVLVRVFARGVTPLKAKTNRYGRVTFKLKKLGRGKRLVLRKLRFHAAKTGFLPGRRSIVIRY